MQNLEIKNEGFHSDQEFYEWIRSGGIKKIKSNGFGIYMLLKIIAIECGKYPGHKTVAEQTGLSINVVKNQLKKLTELGLIEIDDCQIRLLK